MSYKDVPSEFYAQSQGRMSESQSKKLDELFHDFRCVQYTIGNDKIADLLTDMWGPPEETDAEDLCWFVKVDDRYIVRALFNRKDQWFKFSIGHGSNTPVENRIAIEEYILGVFEPSCKNVVMKLLQNGIIKDEDTRYINFGSFGEGDQISGDTAMYFLNRAQQELEYHHERRAMINFRLITKKAKPKSRKEFMNSVRMKTKA